MKMRSDTKRVMRRAKARRITAFLKRKYFGKGAVQSVSRSPFEVLIACILSQRTKEENTERAARALFKLARTPHKMAKLPIARIERAIKPAGFWRQKARAIKRTARIIAERYGGRVPADRRELLSLPGVGYKTADVVLCYGFGIPTIPVDVHVNITSKRLGLVDAHADVEEVRRQLEALIPPPDRVYINIGMVLFGRDVCRTRRPRCEVCELRSICDYYISRTQRAKKSRRAASSAEKPMPPL